MSRAVGTDLALLPLTEAADRLRTGTVRPAEVLDSCLERIAAREPRLHAWARVDAGGARDRARSLGGPPVTADRPLWGVPVGVKDNIGTAGLATTAGSALLAGNVPARDAQPVHRLREAGAVVLGKTMCTELATNDPAPTRNPWSAAHTPGGSSAGSGVAVAARMCFATVDTQTAGDVLRPAAYNGVVGFKPTYGRIGRRGVVPVAWSIDTIGVQARTVRDVVLLFAVLAGPDPEEPAPPEGNVPEPSAAVAALERSPRIGVIRDYFYEQADEEVRRHTDAVADALAAAGASVEEVHPDVDFSLYHAAHRTVTFSECAAVHEDLYRRHAAEMGGKLRTLLELGMVTPAVSYVQAQRVRARLGARLQRALRPLDAVLTPTAGTPAPADLTGTGNSTLQIPWTFGGFPAISLPTGLGREGLPLAVQLVGGYFTEQRLLSVADWCDRALDVRLPVPDLP